MELKLLQQTKHLRESYENRLDWTDLVYRVHNTVNFPSSLVKLCRNKLGTMTAPGAIAAAFRTMAPSRQFVNTTRPCLTRFSPFARQTNCDIADSQSRELDGRRSFRTSASSRWRLDSGLDARNHSHKKDKFSFDPDLGSDSLDVTKKIMTTTLNEAVIFEHFNQKGRRLPRV